MVRKGLLQAGALSFAVMLTTAFMPVTALVAHADTIQVERSASKSVTAANFLDYFDLQGTASYDAASGIVTLTEDARQQVGNFTLNDEISLKDSFKLVGAVNLGTKLDTEGGADGIGVAFHAGAPSDIGQPGGSIGIGGLKDALGFKLDTYWNAASDTIEEDPYPAGASPFGNPYGAFVRTASSDGNRAVTDRASVQYLANGGSQTGDLDGSFHPFTITYDGTTQQLTVTFASVKGLLTWQTAVPSTASAYAFAVSASTGDNTNRQQFRIDSFDYQSYQGSLQARVQDEDSGAAVKGAVFAVVDEEGNQIANGVASDASGSVVIDKLPMGSYQLLETKAAFGYQAVTEPQAFTLTPEAPQGQLTLQRKKLTGTTIVTVSDSQTKQGISGNRFLLADAAGTTVQKNLTTDQAGQLRLTDLPYGAYQLIETQAAAGYTASDPISFTLEQAELSISLTKQAAAVTKYGAVWIQVADSRTSRPLAEAAFELSNLSGQVLQRVVSDQKGQIRIPHLAYGTYRLKETRIPAGYQPSAEQTFTLAQKTLRLQIDKVQEQGTLQVRVSDGAGKPLPGAAFVCVAADGTAYDTQTSDSRGLVSWQKMPYGSYQVRQLTAPEGYQLADVYQAELQQSFMSVTIKNPALTITEQDKESSAQEAGSKPGAAAVVDKTAAKAAAVSNLTSSLMSSIAPRTGLPAAGQEKGLLTIFITGDKNSLAGAVFAVWDVKNPTVSYYLTTDMRGRAQQMLPYGEYEVRQVKSPLGYVADQGVYHFSFSKENQRLDLSIRNQLFSRSTIRETIDGSDKTIVPTAARQLSWQTTVTFGTDVLPEDQLTITNPIQAGLRIESVELTLAASKPVGETIKEAQNVKIYLAKQNGSYDYLIGKTLIVTIKTAIE